SLDQIAGFGRASQRAMQLDFDRAAQFGRNLEQAASRREVDTQLAQLNAVPLISGFPSWEAPILVAMRKERFERFIESISKTLHRGGRNVCTASALKQGCQVVLAQELLRHLIVLFLTLQHLVVDVERLVQAQIQTTALFSVWIQAVLIRSHTFSYSTLKGRVQPPFWSKAAGYPL